jgi:hypothetical protein
MIPLLQPRSLIARPADVDSGGGNGAGYVCDAKAEKPTGEGEDNRDEIER